MLLNSKIQCYEQYGADALEYYRCFDRVEGQIVKDMKMANRVQQELDDELTICWHSCKGAEKSEECLDKCARQFRENVSGIYNRFYKEKVGREREYVKIK